MNKRSLAELQGHCLTEISVQTHYENCAAQGIDYGTSFQCITELYGGADESLGLVRLSDTLQLETKQYRLHPALLDSCLQVSNAAITIEATYLPFAVEQLRLYQGEAKAVWSYAKLRESAAVETGQAMSLQFDITLFSELGDLVAEISGLTLRQAQIGQRLRTDWLYQLAWQPSALPRQSPFSDKRGAWLIVPPSDYKVSNLIIANALADLLRTKGETVVISEELGVMREPYRGVIYWGLDNVETGHALSPQNAPDATLQFSTHALTVVQQLIKAGHKPNLWFITQNSLDDREQTTDASTVYHLPSTSLWGLGRTIMWEHPELNCRCIDLDAATSAETVFNTIWYADNENQIRLHDGQRQVARLARYVEEKLK